MSNGLAKLLSPLVLAGTALFTAANSRAAEPLGSYDVDKSAISVSGLSSGGYMAQQFHVAHSKEVMGVGIVAGGPWDCAVAKSGWMPVLTATDVCSHTVGSYMPFMGPPDADASISLTKIAARDHTIDPLADMAKDKIFLFSGTKDTLVPTSVVNSLMEYYAAFVPASQIKYVKNVPAEHAMVTDGYGKSCDYLGSPYINNCRYDLAGEILGYIYGDLRSPGDPATGGKLLEFNQAQFLPASSISMAPVGHVFVPADCEAGQSCRLHIAFHGCEQDQDQIGDAYYKSAGYNRWAVTNHIIVLYPQTVASSVNPQNPNACWDWWGYTDARFATHSGKQIVAVQKMVDRLTSKSTE